MSKSCSWLSAGATAEIKHQMLPVSDFDSTERAQSLAKPPAWPAQDIGVVGHKCYYHWMIRYVNDFVVSEPALEWR